MTKSVKMAQQLMIIITDIYNRTTCFNTESCHLQTNT